MAAGSSAPELFTSLIGECVYSPLVSRSIWLVEPRCAPWIFNHLPTCPIEEKVKNSQVCERRLSWLASLRGLNCSKVTNRLLRCTLSWLWRECLGASIIKCSLICITQHVFLLLWIQRDIIYNILLCHIKKDPFYSLFVLFFLGVFITKGDVGVGTIVGSAVFNVLVIIGLCGIFAGQVQTR